MIRRLIFAALLTVSTSSQAGLTVTEVGANKMYNMLASIRNEISNSHELELINQAMQQLAKLIELQEILSGKYGYGTAAAHRIASIIDDWIPEDYQGALDEFRNGLGTYREYNQIRERIVKTFPIYDENEYGYIFGTNHSRNVAMQREEITGVAEVTAEATLSRVKNQLQHFTSLANQLSQAETAKQSLDINGAIMAAVGAQQAELTQLMATLLRTQSFQERTRTQGQKTETDFWKIEEEEQ